MAKERQRRPIDRHEVVKDRANRRLNIAIAVLVTAILAEGGYILLTSSFFHVRQIYVSGNRRVARQSIIKDSRIGNNTSVLSLPSGDIEARVEREPWIAGATVSHRWPFDVAIAVKERVPLAVLSAGPVFYLLDRDSVVIERRSSNTHGDLPVIREAPAGDDLAPGDRIADASVTNAMACLRNLGPVVRTEMVFISAPSVDGLTIHMKSGLVVLYGKNELPKQKNYAIEVIMEEGRKEGKSWKYIDVRVPSNPAAAPVG